MRGGPGTNAPGQISWPRVGLVDLLMRAYGVRLDQISGSDWIHDEMYSVLAKIPPNTAKDQFNLMLQNLLAERFRLNLHHVTKEFTVYTLLVAKGGPKMKPSDPEASQPASQASWDNKGFPVLRAGARIAMGTSVGPHGMVRSTHRQTMAEFADSLGAMVNMSNGDGIVRGSPPLAHVIDKTGLTGAFEFTLEFAGSALPSHNPPEARGTDDPSGPSLFSALEQQLGLKLEKGKAGLDVLVIDHADKVPTED